MPGTVSLLDVAQVAVQDFKKARAGEVTSAMVADLTSIIELALLTAVRAERRACSAECTRRAELWEKTGDNPDTSPLLRGEARARASAAHYLGDLIGTRR